MKIENWKLQNINESEELLPQMCRAMLEDGKDAKCKRISLNSTPNGRKSVRPSSPFCQSKALKLKFLM